MSELTPLPEYRPGRMPTHEVSGGNKGYSSLHSSVHSSYHDNHYTPYPSPGSWRSGRNLPEISRNNRETCNVSVNSGTQLPLLSHDNMFDVTPSRSGVYTRHPRGPTRLQSTPPTGVPVTTHLHSGVKNALMNYIGDCHFQYLREHTGTDKVTYYVYAARVSTGLLIEHRYILIITPAYYGDYAKPQTMHWTSFQTRTYNDELPISASVDITPNTDERIDLQHYTITLENNYRDYYDYNCPLAPIKVKILLKPKNFGELPITYPDTGHLAQAFETYNCIITFL